MIEVPWWSLLVPALILAAAWGDLRRQTANYREISTARHDENRDTLKEIRDDQKELWDDVKRINGSVGRHDVEIQGLRRDFDRRNGGS